MGDGTFTDSTLLDAIYTLGPEDISNHGVILVLTALEVSPCTGNFHDSLNILITGMEDNPNMDLALNIFPNPTAGIINLKAKIPANQNAIIQVIDNNGKIIFEGIYYPENSRFESRLDMSYLKLGYYYIRLTSKGLSKTSMVVLTK